MTSEVQETSNEAVDSGPKVNILYSVPSFSAPDPDSVKEIAENGESILNWGGVRVMKISPEVVVKCGSHVTVNEAKSMIYVAQNTKTMPVPKIFAYYTYGPIPRDIKDYGSLFDTYIFMSLVEGQSLDKVWESYNEETKIRVTGQLTEYFRDLRNIDHGSYIGSVDHGPVLDPILKDVVLPDSYARGPFESEEDFNNALIAAYLANSKRCMKKFLTGMLSANKHRIVFTHGDLRLANIMVKDGNVTGVVYWEFSGWYPEYWEFSKALYTWYWQNDWLDYLMEILQPYYFGYTLHSFISQTLW